MFIGAYAAATSIWGKNEWTMQGFCSKAREKFMGDVPFAGGPDVGNPTGFQNGGQLQIEGQLIVFVVSSVVLLLVFRKMLRNRFFNNSKESDDELADEYIGKTAVALTDFANGHGEVEFKGSKWEALSADEIRKGDTVVISSRESIKLTVEKK